MLKYIINNNKNQNNKGIGISIPFGGSTGFNTTYTTKDATRSNLINFLLTNKRERIFNPNFGADIRKFLFEKGNESDIQDLREYILYGIKTYFPQININKMDITPNGHLLEIYFNYSIINTNIEDEFNITFS